MMIIPWARVAYTEQTVCLSQPSIQVVRRMFIVTALHSLPRRLSVTLHVFLEGGVVVKILLLALSCCSSGPENML